MTYFASVIEEKDRGDFSRTYPFIRFYPSDEDRIPAVLYELYSTALDYARKRGEIPQQVAVFRDCVGEENGEQVFLRIYMMYHTHFVYAKLMKITGADVELDPLPEDRGGFGPVFHRDWNIIYRNVHYREDFLSVFEQFLRGIDPPVLPNAYKSDEDSQTKQLEKQSPAAMLACRGKKPMD